MTSAGATSSDPENTSSDTRTCARNRSGSERTGARRGSDRSTSRSVSSSSTRAHIVAGARARGVAPRVHRHEVERWDKTASPKPNNETSPRKPWRPHTTRRARRPTRRRHDVWLAFPRANHGANDRRRARGGAFRPRRAPFPRPDDAHRARRVRHGAHRRRRSPRPPSLSVRAFAAAAAAPPTPLSPRVPRQDSHARHDLPRLPRRAPRGEHPRPDSSSTSRCPRATSRRWRRTTSKTP